MLIILLVNRMAVTFIVLPQTNSWPGRLFFPINTFLINVSALLRVFARSLAYKLSASAISICCMCSYISNVCVLSPGHKLQSIQTEQTLFFRLLARTIEMS